MGAWDERSEAAWAAAFQALVGGGDLSAWVAWEARSEAWAAWEARSEAAWESC